MKTYAAHRFHALHIAIVSLTLCLTSACGTAQAPGSAPAGGDAASVTPAPPAGYVQTELAAGSGTQAAKGAQVTVKYTGWIYDASKPDNKGTKFDSTDDHDPITFRLGNGEVIPGWDRGLEGMRVGGKRRLVIPPDLGYGAEGTPGGPIPPNAGLVFDVEMADVK